MANDSILTLAPPPADARVRYGGDPNQFGDLRFPKSDGPFAVVMMIHGGFWRAKYDLEHAGHLCAALTAKGLATWNVEYRRVGNAGGGWPGTFQDIGAAFRFVQQIAKRYNLDASRVVVMGHSAGGQLALCLAAHQPAVKHVVSLAGVVDLQAAYEQHLGNDAVVEFLGGKPSAVADHYRDADPMELSIPKAAQWLIHGEGDDTVPPDFSVRYVQTRKARAEDVHLLEVGQAGHYELIDPRSAAWGKVEGVVRHEAG
jgi:acetyl esterase/lipase